MEHARTLMLPQLDQLQGCGAAAPVGVEHGLEHSSHVSDGEEVMGTGGDREEGGCDLCMCMWVCGCECVCVCVCAHSCVASVCTE